MQTPQRDFPYLLLLFGVFDCRPEESGPERSLDCQVPNIVRVAFCTALTLVCLVDQVSLQACKLRGFTARERVSVEELSLV